MRGNIKERVQYPSDGGWTKFDTKNCKSLGEKEDTWKRVRKIKDPKKIAELKEKERKRKRKKKDDEEYYWM